MRRADDRTRMVTSLLQWPRVSARNLYIPRRAGRRVSTIATSFGSGRFQIDNVDYKRE